MNNIKFRCIVFLNEPYKSHFCAKLLYKILLCSILPDQEFCLTDWDHVITALLSNITEMSDFTD